MIQQATNTPFTLGPVDTDRACLLLHGFTGTPSEMRSMGEALASQGVRVQAVLLAGHAGSPEELIHTGRKEWLASAEARTAAGALTLVDNPEQA